MLQLVDNNSAKNNKMYSQFRQYKILFCHQVVLFSVLFIIRHAEAKVLDLETLETFDGSSNEIDDSDSTRRIIIKDGEVSLSLPGTKWCGPGNTAANYDDLGKFETEDKCCRDHDNCDNIGSGATKYGLTNTGKFTILNCDCDKSLKKCLKSANTSLANKIGRIYFSLRTKCYKDSYPVVGCSKDQTKIFMHRCVVYNVDSSKPKSYQWFDLPFYSTSSAGVELSDFDD